MATQEIQIGRKEIAPGIFTTGGTATMESPNIPVSNITPAQPINLGTPAPITPPTIPPQLPNIETPVQNQNDSMIQSLIQGLGATEGKAADTLNIQNDANVVATTAEANRLSDLYKTRSNEYDKMVVNTEDRSRNVVGTPDTTVRALYGQQGVILRQKAIDLEKINQDYQIATKNYDKAVESAQRIVDLKYKPLEEKNQIYKDQLLAIAPMLDAEQKKVAATLLAQQKAEETALAEQKQQVKDNYSLATTYAKYAFDAGQSQLSSQIQALDPNSPTFKMDLQKLQAQIQNPAADMEMELKDLQIKQARANLNKTLMENDASSPVAIKAQAQSQVLDNISLVDSVLNSPYLSQVTGLKNPLTYWTPGTNEQYVKSQLNQVINSLSLENRAKLKGQGAVSDFEGKMLARASSALTPGLSDKDAKKELSKIKGIFSTAAGLTAPVKITDKNGVSQVVEASREGINQALIDGLTVEYQ